MYLAWYSGGNYTVGVDASLKGRVIADCISANYPIPLGTDAVINQDSLTVGALVFNRIPRPAEPHLFDRIEKYPS